MKNALVASLVLSVFFSIEILGQSSNATVSGTVADSSDAVVPGVTITATNNATGVVTSVVSNDAGAYSIVGLLPGSYTISGSLPGFQTQTYSNVQLGNAAQVRLNFTLQVSGVAQSVEVTIAAENLITSSSSSVGEVLPQRQVEDLPLVSNNVLDLVGVMAGVFMTNDAVFGAEQTNFAGVSARDVNVQRDGVSLNSQRWPNGLDAPTRMNPDLVGEIRLILAPVDAEMGRGNGQVQIPMPSTAQPCGMCKTRPWIPIFGRTTGRFPASLRSGETFTITASLSAALSSRTNRFSTSCGISKSRSNGERPSPPF
jgi:hypothetical protein